MESSHQIVMCSRCCSAKEAEVLLTGFSRTGGSTGAARPISCFALSDSEAATRVYDENKDVQRISILKFHQLQSRFGLK
jgi:hypothetical protein